MQEKFPGCYFFIGSNNKEKHLDYGHHHPKFDFDEEALGPRRSVDGRLSRGYTIRKINRQKQELMETLNMKTATTIFNWLIRITGLFQLIIGVIFWVNQDDNLVPVHTLVGVILVLSLWIMAFLAARAGVNWKMTALAFVWGLVVVILGLTQTQILPGNLPLADRGPASVARLGSYRLGGKAISRCKAHSTAKVIDIEYFSTPKDHSLYGEIISSTLISEVGCDGIDHLVRRPPSIHKPLIHSSLVIYTF